MLYCTDSDTSIYFVWGWYENDGTLFGKETLFPDNNKWYFRLPTGHVFDPINYNYFVITYFDTTSGCGSRSFYNAPVDIAENKEASITVFPNPTDGALNIRFENVNKSQTGILQLFNISGQLIYQNDINILGITETVRITDVWYQEAGIYILRVRTDDYFFNSKIIVR